MATYGSAIRRGLPRVRGGEPWPAAGDAPVDAAPAVPVDAAPAAPAPAPAPAAPAPAASDVESSQSVGVAAPDPQIAATETSGRAIRRGLPRVPGGEPWPPAGTAPETVGVSSSPTAGVAASEPQIAASEAVAPTATDVESSQTAGIAASDPQIATTETSGRAIRRGLPRTPGGEPWPPAGFAPAIAPAPTTAPSSPPSAPSTIESSQTAGVAASDPQIATIEPTTAAAQAPAAAAPAAPAPAAPAAAPAGAVATITEPLGTPQTVHVTPNASRWNADRVARQGKAPIAPAEPKRYGPFTALQWTGAVIVVGGGLLVAAAMVVFATRWFLSLDFMRDFLATYPGEYHLPETAPVGLPAWIGWQHFFNVFLMVLIIRSGLQVRHVKRPTAFWTPRTSKDGRGKISLSLWFHQALDILWLVNGVVFVVLLFVTGQWMRIIPTSWEVIPNALSAALQYASLDWPTENGWVNYNSLQQLAYGATVFLAAPLAAITGVRMSGLWPKNAKALNKAYPVEWARAVHFPVMVYFVLFIVVHVTLVFATGALRNLNHMYAAQGSTDPTAYADNWAGFWIFLASLVVIIGGWIAARPLVLAPIARLFGTVSSR